MLTPALHALHLKLLYSKFELVLCLVQRRQFVGGDDVVTSFSQPLIFNDCLFISSC